MPLNDSELHTALFSEKNLADVNSTYRSAFPSPSPAWKSAFISLIMLICCSLYLNNIGNDTANLLKYSEQVVDYTVVLYSTFFGIAIAGFSIFASALRGPTLAALIEKKEKNSQAPFLRYLFGIFVFTLSVLFWMIVLAFSYHLIFSEGSPFFSNDSEIVLSLQAQQILVLAFMSIYLSAVVYALCILHSFVWNLYQVLLVVSAMSYREWRDTEANHPSSTPK